MENSYTSLNKWLEENLPEEPAATTTAALTTTTTTPTAPLNYRLPTNLKPYNYDVLLKVQFETIVQNSFPYDGELTIYFNCVEDTNNLIFHINKLEINNATLSVRSLTDSSFSEIRGFNWTNDFERQFFMASLPQTFKRNHSYTVFVQFTGYLTDDNAGFYRSSYTADDGQKRWLLASQMEPTDARKSFPCFDEPAMKATFKISVEHRDDYNAISNMPIAGVTPL